MKNRTIRDLLTLGTKGNLIVNLSLINNITVINNNSFALSVVSRYNRILKHRQHLEKLKTHTVKAIFNHIGQYEGCHYVAKQV